MTERYEKRSRLARDVLNLDRNTLLVNLRFMDMALSQFRFLENDQTTLATDGQYLVYDPSHVLNVFKNEKEASVRDYLHVVMHCVYRHMFLHSLMDQKLWDLACDIAVEKTITDMGLRSADAKRARLQEQEILKLENKLKIITAQKMYYHFLDSHMSERRIAELSALFKADDHQFWYMSEEKKQAVLGTGSSSSQEGQENEQNNGGGNQNGNTPDSSRSSMSEARALEETWKDISEHMQMDLDTFSKQQGNASGNLIQNLREVNREKYDYSSFLRRFAVRGEVMKLDMDEFDYIFYTYGLNMYGNMPLIEPLEYKEVPRIKEFVIAIDTSGSTSGDLVQRFIKHPEILL